MKIGLVTGEYPPMEGGVGAFTRELAKELAQLGHEIHIITSREARPEPEEGGKLPLGQLREPVELPYGFLHPRGRRWRWGDVGMIADLALRHRLDVINIQYQAAAYNMRSWAINLAPWRLRGVATIVTTFHDLRVPYLFPKAGPVRPLAVRLLARHSSGVIATNGQDMETLARWNIPQENRRRIPIGSNISVYSPLPGALLAARRQLGLRPVDCLLGYFGFLNESKGADTLVRSLARLDEHFHLVFIGGRTGASDRANNQAFLDNLDQLVDELGVAERVHWTGFLEDEEVSTLLHAADLIVLPYRDGVSLRRGTLMAALAHGRPVISTEPATPVAELAHGEQVWLVPPNDAEALQQAVRQLAGAPQKREQLGRQASEVAKQFAWDRIAADTADFFEYLAHR